MPLQLLRFVVGFKFLKDAYDFFSRRSKVLAGCHPRKRLITVKQGGILGFCPPELRGKPRRKSAWKERSVAHASQKTVTAVISFDVHELGCGADCV
jgi:hypothetical protein